MEKESEKSRKKRNMIENSENSNQLKKGNENNDDVYSKLLAEGKDVEFEDPYGDEIENEEYLFDEDFDDESSTKEKMGKSDESESYATEEEEEEDEMEKQDESDENKNIQSWIPGRDSLNDEEELEYDSSAYDMLHFSSLDWPCLSFDIIKDDLGVNRSEFPHTVYVVAGTQADSHDKNKIYVMKWSKLHKTDKDANDDSDDDSDEDNDEDIEDPILDFRVIAHPGVVNRIRVCPQISRLVATWSENTDLYIWDVDNHLKRLDSSGKPANTKQSSMYTCSSHKSEGFAMDWSVHTAGRFLSGDCGGKLFLWEPVEAGWDVQPNSFVGHKASVEDVQWKVKGHGCQDVFASACVDKCIRVFDVRESNRKPSLEIVNAHDSDVNVIRWSCIQSSFILSGADDGCIKVWDERLHEMPIVKLHWHKKPITSVDWHPTDEATFGCSCYDNSISLWDLSVEAEKTNDSNDGNAYPDQLMFHHLGQKEITEMRFHPQIPGVVISTGINGFNIFKTANI